jgi:hypothetical protein
MATVSRRPSAPPLDGTIADLLKRLGGIPPKRVRLVWFIDPRTRTARSYTAPDQCQPIGEDGALGGGDVLPGFELALRDLFAEAEGSGA